MASDKRAFLQELQLAEDAIAAGDLEHAAHHACGALALDPTSTRALALVDKLIDEQPKPRFALLPAKNKKKIADAPLFDDDDFFGSVAVKARAAWRRGKLDVAFDLLVQLQLAIRHLDYSAWLLKLVDDGAANASAGGAAHLSPRPFFTAFSALSGPFIGLLHLRPGERALFSTWAEIGFRLVDAQGRHPDPLLSMAASGMLRRAGRFEDALRVAERGLASAEDPSTATNLLTQRGLAQRALGRFDEAVATFLEARELGKDNVYSSEAARARMDQGRPADALALFAEGDIADDGEVQLAMDVCRLASGTPPLAGVAQAVFGHPERLSYDDVRRVFLGDGSGLRMSDATTNAVRNLQRQQPDAQPPIKLTMSTTAFESPSVLLSLALFCSGTSSLRGLQYSASRRPEPPSHEPLDRQLGARLWRWLDDDALPTQAVDAPDPQTAGDVLALIKNLADGSPATGTRRARALAAQSVVDAAPTSVLFAALVHPPPPPPGALVDVHVFDWQVACALLLGARKPTQPWLASERRTSLRELVLGPPDWTTAAGLIALTEALLDDPAALDDAREWIDMLVAHAPDVGHCPWAGALAHLVARVPAFRPDVLDAVQPWLQSNDDGTESGDGA